MNQKKRHNGIARKGQGRRLPAWNEMVRKFDKTKAVVFLKAGGVE